METLAPAYLILSRASADRCRYRFLPPNPGPSNFPPYANQAWNVSACRLHPPRLAKTLAGDRSRARDRLSRLDEGDGEAEELEEDGLSSTPDHFEPLPLDNASVIAWRWATFTDPYVGAYRRRLSFM